LAIRPVKGKQVSGPIRPLRPAWSDKPGSVVAGMPRIGHGYDIHKLQPGGKTVLGGVVVSEEVSPVAHSDGDVVIHAIVDALLGAMGWGDIGEMFPDTDDAWKSADSRSFLEIVYFQPAADRVVPLARAGGAACGRRARARTMPPTHGRAGRGDGRSLRDPGAARRGRYGRRLQGA
jgi:hypothetical protein